MTAGTARTITSWRGISGLAAAVVVAISLYGIGVLVPYYVNGLHHLPLTEVASGAHDPKDLWPQAAWSGLTQLAGLIGLALLPIVAASGVGFGGVSLALLWQRPGPQRVRKSLALLALMIGSLAALLFVLSDTGAALATWRLD
ncbi:hypothetical protein [Pengzhenrongella sicca]|uniref:Uncharacterized protein n=1 Tax=Pengzhenrongella sicca TaxID=2819238 RepID=A0A8A4Z864_9MICO|nr:hypothetical protein [Pengzhenrongella sicca]QTE28100.1 hypothetical protein J4E96_11930 [Pengzhenrongella sicca]